LSPDGTHVAAGRDHIIHLWDLRRIREHLAARGLDWDAPPYPPPGPDRAPGPVVVVSSPVDQVPTRSIAPPPSGIAPPGTATQPH
jgi:hypothetical protein